MSARGNNINDDLLVKFITDQCSDDEVSLINLWLAESVENKNHYTKIEAAWILTRNSYPKLKFDSNQAWKNVSARMGNEKDIEKPIHIDLQKRRGNRKTIYYFSAIAAVLLIGVFISQFLFLEKNLSPIILTSTDGLLSETLKDGSEIALNAGSELSYPEDYNQESRTVSLKGEAFFDIKPNKTKPFIIKSEFGNIRVLGTSFNVLAHENSNFEVQVETGLVQLFTTSNDNKDTSSIFLKAGNSGIINYKTGALFKQEKKDPASLFWLNKQLNFNKTPLAEVFQLLEKYYPIHIDFNEIILSNCKLTVKFENESIDTILEVISATFNFEIEKSQSNQIKVLANDPDCPVENI